MTPLEGLKAMTINKVAIKDINVIETIKEGKTIYRANSSP